jgi:ABC-2 type transport system ATP-binding protein
LFKADSGRLEILGQDIDLSDTRRKIGFVLDTDGLYDNMTAEDNLRLYARIYGLDDPGDRIKKLMEMVELGDRVKDNVRTYSKGMRQRLALARAMLHDPEVLIMDEPTAGVDPSGQIKMRHIMLDIARKENKTIFLSSHNLDEVQRICNRIALIDRGAIKLYGKLKELRSGMSEINVVIRTASNVSETLLAEIADRPELGLQKKDEKKLIFSPEAGTETSDIISYLASRGVKIDEATKRETTLEEMYSAILKEAEPS